MAPDRRRGCREAVLAAGIGPTTHAVGQDSWSWVWERAPRHLVVPVASLLDGGPMRACRLDAAAEWICAASRFFEASQLALVKRARPGRSETQAQGRIPSSCPREYQSFWVLEKMSRRRRRRLRSQGWLRSHADCGASRRGYPCLPC